jgi:4-amino-4-deoxy-L-arabinose transferase-like glycosyltransferase
VSGAPYQRALPWLGLLCVLSAFIVAVVRVHPTNFFGFSEDDSIYFSSAKALAQGKGYVLVSFPGAPAATKYPVVYPWILSWVWRVNPSFPANLPDAIGISVAFGLLFLTMVFLFARRLKGISDVEALLITAFCALHPRVIFYGGQLLTEIPFAALVLAGIVLAECAMGRETDSKYTAASGVVTGIAILLRVLGAPIAAGIAVAFALRRSWRQLGIFCASVAPFLGVTAWGVLFPRLAESPASGPAASSLSWIETWAYYSNYLHVWKDAVPSASAFMSVLGNSALFLLRAPAEYFAEPFPAARTFIGEAFAILVTIVIVNGVLRLRKGCGVRSAHWALGLYVLVIFLWVYMDDERFLFPFLPIFAAAVWVEGKRLVGLVRTGLKGGRPMADRVLACAFGAAILAMLCAMGFDYAGGVRKEVTDLSESRAAILPEKLAAYDWLKRSTGRDARVVAYEDASLFLFTGRQAVRPFRVGHAFLNKLTNEGEIPRDVMNLAEAIGAKYWVVSDDDFDPGRGKDGAKGRTDHVKATVPLAFISARGKVRVYSLPGDRVDQVRESVRR